MAPKFSISKKKKKKKKHFEKHKMFVVLFNFRKKKKRVPPPVIDFSRLSRDAKSRQVLYDKTIHLVSISAHVDYNWQTINYIAVIVVIIIII